MPFDTATLRNAGLAEMLRIIREDEAPSLARSSPRWARRRPTLPNAARPTRSLRRLVDGDLNSITMKALEKARERRYASVSDLAADIQNHLEHRPVLASPPGRLSRTRKFLRRHRAAALRHSRRTRIPRVDRGDGLVAFTSRFPTRPTLTEKDTIVLADFTNQTGDPSSTMRSARGCRSSSNNRRSS